MRKLFVATVIGLLLLIGAASALADPNPSPTGTGQPSQTCLSNATGPNEPGQAAGAPGSAFNETSGIAGPLYAGNGATTNTPASGNAVAQYDVACYQVSH
jgi:hypothetical protein